MQMKSRLLALVIAALLLAITTSPALRAAAPVPDSSNIDEGKYAVQWTFTVNGSASSSTDFSSWTAYRNVLIQGSATSYTPPNGFSVTEPFQLTVTDSSHSVENGNCWQKVVDESITDP